jgi:hypothetical protein
MATTKNPSFLPESQSSGFVTKNNHGCHPWLFFYNKKLIFILIYAIIINNEKTTNSTLGTSA